jgi:predicted NAD/FAD-dependent oxidoreductase
VLHATPAWTREHVNAAPERVATALVAALAAAVGRALPAPTFADAHRWRYAQGALDPAPGALVDAQGALAVAGDWCHGGRIEGAWLSGTLAAARLLEAREDLRR